MATSKQIFPHNFSKNIEQIVGYWIGCHSRHPINPIQERKYTMQKIIELKEAMQAYIKAKKACDKAEQEMVRTETEESEKAFAITYSEMFIAYIDVSKMLSVLIGISERKARTMINTKETEVIALIEKLGA